MNFGEIWHHPWTQSLAGGALIGAAASLLFLWNGRLFGVSGIVGGALSPKRGDTAWRYALLVGMVTGGAVLFSFAPETFDPTPVRPLWAIAAAGLLVGFGTRLGGGCTSGHGICGISRLSKRSFVATLTFMAAGIATAVLFRRLGGGA